MTALTIGFLEIEVPFSDPLPIADGPAQVGQAALRVRARPAVVSAQPAFDLTRIEAPAAADPDGRDPVRPHETVDGDRGDSQPPSHIVQGPHPDRRHTGIVAERTK